MAATSASFSTSTALCFSTPRVASYNSRKHAIVTFPHQFSAHRPLLRVARPMYLQGTVRSGGTDTNGILSTAFSLPVLPGWAKWVFGALILLAVPRLKKLRDVGVLIQQVDAVVETVEVIAEKAEKIAEDIAEDLPDGEMKNAVLQVEKASEAVATQAKFIDNVLDKTTEIVNSLFNSRAEEGEAANKSMTTDRASQEKAAAADEGS